MLYTEDNLQADYNVGGSVTFGPQGVSGTVGAQAGSPGTCTTCGQTALLKGLSLPILLIAIAVVVLAFRK
jgi:hypothetical protein